jgi:hypothetical protein
MGLVPNHDRRTVVDVNWVEWIPLSPVLKFLVIDE